MSNFTEDLARETVAAFCAELSDASRRNIGEAQLERLELLVAEAIAAALHHAAEQVAALGRSLRTESAEESDGMEL